ncbi:P12 family lipoprotein [Borreliella valaisiana]|uniref:P12 family lipoprotein n=1 Tax=Borreliella valaisiana TaxID=62088 RepID=UPI003B20C75C
MKKNILLINMIMLISLLSCNTSASPSTQKNGSDKVLGFLEKIPEENVEVVKQHIEGKEKQMVEAVFLQPVFETNNSPYFLQEEVEIKEEDLVPSTNEEKEVGKIINDTKSFLESSEFAKLGDEEIELENKYKELESSFNSVYNALKKKLGPSFFDVYDGEILYPPKRKLSSEQKNKLVRRYYTRPDITANKEKRQELIHSINQLNNRRADLDRLVSKLEVGLSERTSGKYFFEKAQEDLKKAITERLKSKKNRNYWSRKSDFLAKQALREAKNSLNQLKTSSFKIVEVMDGMKEIEELIKEANDVLS